MCNVDPVKVAITGSSGLIGSALAESLRADGHQVVPVPRDEGGIVTEALKGADAVVHLAGESIGAKPRWNEAHKRRVRQSRLEGTRRVSEALAQMGRRPATLVSGSAVGYYGRDRGDEILDEHAGSGAGFLSELCVAWEAATGAAADAGIRVVRARTGIVLDPKGGLLPRFLVPGRLGLGARLGRGRQWISWISLADEVRALRHLLADESIEGPVNLVAPSPVTNATFTRTVGRVLGRPAVLMVPEFALKAALGAEAAEETVLASQRVEPAALTACGFSFAHPELEPALREMLGR